MSRVLLWLGTKTWLRGWPRQSVRMRVLVGEVYSPQPEPTK